MNVTELTESIDQMDEELRELRTRVRILVDKRKVLARQRRVAVAEESQAGVRKLIEDVEWLLPTMPAADVAEKLGYDNPASLATRLRRWGRSDLATPFWKAKKDVA